MLKSQITDKRSLFIILTGLLISIIFSGCSQQDSLENGMVEGMVKIDDSEEITLPEKAESGDQVYDPGNTGDPRGVTTSNTDTRYYIINFNKKVNKDQVRKILEDKADISKELNKKTFSVKLSSGDSENFLKSLESEELVSYVEPDTPVVPMAVPNDPLYNSGEEQWNLKMLNLENVWEEGYTGSNEVTVAVLDTGVVSDHPDLEDNLIQGKDFIDEDDDPEDNSEDFSHGTHVAGTIGAVTDNNEGIAGINWDINIMPVRVMEETSGTSSQLAEGIEWAVDNGADVINMSLALGRSQPPQLLEDAIKYAHDSGVVLIGAAGNDGISSISYPARFDEVISVGAVDTSKEKTDFSNYGENLDIVAPGSNILSTNTPVESDGDTLYYTPASGTSMAAPHVAGITALLIDSGYNNPEEIANVLKQSAEDLGPSGFDENYGHGLVDINRALELDDSNLDEGEIDKDGSNEDDYSGGDDTDSGQDEINLEKIRIYGIKDGNDYTEADTGIINPDSEGNFSLETAPGTWTIVAWLDLNKNDSIDSGDYLGELENTRIDENGVNKNNEIKLKEVQ